ncbi:hypothetical protein GGQ67_004048 [Rhizobium metallidurans]|uniref:Uncharacterized protein n=1 Tax=Rhizobium metallidurans TaxID=1265931 RepID=A0A7W6CTX8_9HYPH|nr:hypothetical protein [Rhizobium metallidurans]
MSVTFARGVRDIWQAKAPANRGFLSAYAE